MIIFLSYLVIINLLGLFIMYSDKRKAKSNSWRTPEAVIFNIAFFFGSLGVLIGMRMFHHKTKHFKFVYGIPIILILQIFILYKLIPMFMFTASII